MNKANPILYSFRRCPYAMRARMAVMASGMQVELREVVLRDKPGAMLDVSPKGSVPVLLLEDGQVIDESLEVMLWALSYADPSDWLSPETGNDKEIQAIIEACDGDFKHHLDRYKYASRYEGAVAEEHRCAAEVYLADLEARLDETAFLFGARATLADYAIMPFIRQFANTNHGWFEAAPYPALQAWLSGLLKADIFTGVMGKYAQWHEGDAPVLFPA